MMQMDTNLFIPAVLGWVAGLFINYTADILPLTRRFSQPVCLNCQTAFSWREYLSLRACRNCGTRRSTRIWIVQTVAVASFLYFWLFPPIGLGLLLSMIVLTYFGVIIVIDIEHRLILHPTSIAGAVLGLTVGTFIYSKTNGLTSALLISILGGVAGFGIMFILYQFGAFVARIRARRMQVAGQATDDEEALGGGDVFLAGILGLMLGWPNIILGLTYGVLIGGFISVLAIIQLFIKRRYTENSMMTFIPYGPSLIMGVFYVLFFF